MELVRPDPTLVPYGLRAMKMIAAVDGVHDVAEKSLLATAQQLFGTRVDLDALEPIEPEELARHVVAGTLATMAGLREESALAARFRALEHAPAGSLGRGYHVAPLQG